MPNIDSIDGLKINIYNGDHRPPHIHAVYGEYEALIVIETAEIYAGHLPPKQLKKAVLWLSANTEWAREVFYELNPNLR